MVVTPRLLENGFYRIELDERGRLTSLLDKTAGRQVIEPGARGNVLQAFEDRSIGGEAWEIDLYYREKMRPMDELLEAVVEESGPVRGSLRLVWRLAGSTLTQRLTIYRATPRIDWRCELDWHEHEILLKVAFPVQVRATFATYEIQFGTVERPTHCNTPSDMAHFENPAQRWVDLSEGNYGVALLNDCKHGYDVAGNVLRLTLHRSPTNPDPRADQGRQRFTYSLLPHAGTWREGEVARRAAELNHPLHAAPVKAQPQGDLPATWGLAAVNARHVVLDTVKQAEDGDGWIVRLYEAQQCHDSAVSLDLGRPLRRAVECNLLEEKTGPVAVDGSRVTFAVAPCEIRSFRLWFAEPGE